MAGALAAWGGAGDAWRSVLYALMLALYCLLLAGPWLFVARRAGWRALGLREVPPRELGIVLPLFGLSLLSMAVANGTVALLSGGFDNPQMDILSEEVLAGPVDLVVLLVLMAGLAPLAEEILFRGMIYPLLRKRFAPRAAIVTSAGLFSVAHLIPMLVPGLFAIGLFLAYLRERSGSIWPGVLLHALHNGVTVTIVYITLQMV